MALGGLEEAAHDPQGVKGWFGGASNGSQRWPAAFARASGTPTCAGQEMAVVWTAVAVTVGRHPSMLCARGGFLGLTFWFLGVFNFPLMFASSDVHVITK